MNQPTAGTVVGQLVLGRIGFVFIPLPIEAPDQPGFGAKPIIQCCADGGAQAIHLHLVGRLIHKGRCRNAERRDRGQQTGKWKEPEILRSPEQLSGQLVPPGYGLFVVQVHQTAPGIGLIVQLQSLDRTCRDLCTEERGQARSAEIRGVLTVLVIPEILETQCQGPVRCDVPVQPQVQVSGVRVVS